MKLTRLLDVLEGIAPSQLAESWDQVGLHVGEHSRVIRRALLCIDLTEPVLAEAVEQRCELIVAYHPPIFQAVTRLTDADVRGRLLLEAARRRMVIYSPHTALDAAPGGVTDWLCQGLGRGSSRPIQPHVSAADYKLVTFVPTAYAMKVRDAMFAAGAGQIGDYSHCSFSHPGVGTFKGGEDTSPFIGKPGQLETAEELRLEMACRKASLAQAIAALRKAHPYEEPAFDVFRIEPLPAPDRGAGRIMTLDRPVSVATLARRIKAHLKVRHLDVADAGQPVRTIAVCPGAGGSLLTPLRDVDAMFTGEMRHHDVLAARQRGVSVLLAGHTQTERPYLSVYRRRLERACDGRIVWRVSRADQPPSAIR